MARSAWFTATPREHLAVRRVLKLVDGYLSTQPKDTLLAWRGGVMTWGELRQHLKAAEKLMRPPKRRIDSTAQAKS